MARKAKKKVRAMPKLSLLDKCIYWLLLVIGMVPCVVCTLGTIILRRRIAFADEAVIAFSTHASELWSLPASICLFLVPFIVWNNFYEQRYPIFGIRGFKYGPQGWPRVYPVFMKDKPKFWKSPKKRADRIGTAIFAAIVTIIFCLPLPLSVQGRDVLYADGRVASYNMFGVCTEEVDKPYIESVEFGVYSSKSGRYSSRSWGVSVALRTTEGDTWYFRSADFRRDENAEVQSWLTAMLELKECYAGRVTCGETDWLDFVAADKNLNEEEIRLLMELFRGDTPNPQGAASLTRRSRMQKPKLYERQKVSSPRR